MTKPEKGREDLGFEWIAGMTAQFQDDWNDKERDVTYWQLRILLSIAQQLSVIAGALKDNT